MLFSLINPITPDPNKENIGFIIHNLTTDSNHLFGFSFILKKWLEEKYNIYWIGVDKNPSSFNNFYQYNPKRLKDLSKTSLKRVKEDPQSREKNEKIILNELEKSFNIEFKYLFLFIDIMYQLPQREYNKKEFLGTMNEFHDYTGEDEYLIQKIEETIQRISLNDNVNVLAYTLSKRNIWVNLVRKLHPQRVFSFIIDPAFFWPWFQKFGIRNTNFYFGNDSRGTRDFKYFPIGELQHLVYEPHTQFIQEKEKKKDFFFIGTILQKKGARIECWDRFLLPLGKNYNHNSSLYIPLKMNGIYFSNTRSGYDKKKSEQAKNEMGDIYYQIKTHPLWKDGIPPKMLNNIISEYKYGLILRCVSINDSLNYRIFQYLIHSVLPFFDPLYDPEYIQIPKEFQDQLRVNDAYDIEKKILYFNQNPKERESLLTKMWNYFNIYEWLNNPMYAKDETLKILGV